MVFFGVGFKMVYKTTKHLNKNLYFLGLSAFQALGVFTLLILVFLIFKFIGLAIFAFPIFYLSAKISKENKNGNPNYLDSYLKKSKYNYYTDENNLMNYLIK